MSENRERHDSVEATHERAVEKSIGAIVGVLSLAFALRDDEALRRAVGIEAGRAVVRITRDGSWLEVGDGTCIANRVRPPGLPLLIFAES